MGLVFTQALIDQIEAKQHEAAAEADRKVLALEKHARSHHSRAYLKRVQRARALAQRRMLARKKRG